MTVFLFPQNSLCGMLWQLKPPSPLPPPPLSRTLSPIPSQTARVSHTQPEDLTDSLSASQAVFSIGNIAIEALTECLTDSLSASQAVFSIYISLLKLSPSASQKAWVSHTRLECLTDSLSASQAVFGICRIYHYWSSHLVPHRQLECLTSCHRYRIYHFWNCEADWQVIWYCVRILC